VGVNSNIDATFKNDYLQLELRLGDSKFMHFQRARKMTRPFRELAYARAYLVQILACDMQADLDKYLVKFNYVPAMNAP
jgi:hypothetical protein